MISIRILRRCPFFLLLVLFFCVRRASATVHYTVSLENEAKHVFHVSVNIPMPASNLRVALPAWNALYQIRDFSYRIRDVHGVSLNPHLGLVPEKIDKQMWLLIDPNSLLGHVPVSEIAFGYSIEWNDPGPFNSQLDVHHAFLNFAEVLMYVLDRRGEDVVVKFDHLPEGWKIAAELPKGEEPNSFIAPSYDALVDAPVEIGKFEEFTFTEAGAPIHVVVDAKEWNKGRLEGSLRRITGYELKLMGGAPFKEYTFFFRIGPYAEVGGGGMEHANCTAISAGSIEGAVATAAHEFFHLWNVKRIRPQTLQPVDYTKEQYTRALWFAEGITSTYGAYALERSGVYTKEQWYGDLSEQITELQARPARLWQSVEESSLDAWLEKYDDYRQPDRSISYYNKGQIDGVLLDLAIRDATGNKRSLDDVMRSMNEMYAKAGKFYNDSEGIRGVVEEVASQSFEEFFRRYVAGTDEIPYDKFLAAAGLELKVDSSQLSDLGFRAGRTPGVGPIVAQVVTGSTAEAAGLQKGDVLLGLNGEGFPRNIRGWLRDHHAGEKVKLRVRRDGEEREITYALAQGGGDRHYSIVESSNPTDKQRRIREGMLHGTTD
jgi:predicted metalloprotease with PDZ domain